MRESIFHEESFEPPVSPPTEEGNIIDRILYELFLNNLLVSTLKSINRRIVDAFVEYEFYRILVSLGKLVRRNGTDSGGNTTQRPLNFNISSIADLTRPFNPNMTAYADNTPQKITPPTDIFLANY
uniref:Uncharacterized protein n=1 Tax=Tetranychus urticae TaxID=32264 RepID=T1KA65_TETUR